MNLFLLQDAVTVFLGIFIEALPFVLLGVLVSNFIQVYVGQEMLLRMIPQGRVKGAIAGTIVGFFFPVCECGNVPVARRLILKGVAPHVAITFLLAAPVINPVVILATMAAFRGQPEMVVLRVLFSFAIALAVGILFSFVKNPKEYIQPRLLVKHDGKTAAGHHHPKFRQFVSGMVHEFFEMASVLTIGGLIASFTQALVPRHVITSIGSGPVSSVIAMMVLAFVVSICSNVDAFFALSYSTNFTSASLLAFLVFGPMMDIKAFFMLQTVFRLRAVVWIALLTAQLTMLITLFMNLRIS